MTMSILGLPLQFTVYFQLVNVHFRLLLLPSSFDPKAIYDLRDFLTLFDEKFWLGVYPFSLFASRTVLEWSGGQEARNKKDF